MEREQKLLTIIDHLCFDLAFAHLEKEGEVELGDPRIREHSEVIKAMVLEGWK